MSCRNILNDMKWSKIGTTGIEEEGERGLDRKIFQNIMAKILQIYEREKFTYLSF